MESDALIPARHRQLEGILDERQRRLYAAVEAKVLGHGGVKPCQRGDGSGPRVDSGWNQGVGVATGESAGRASPRSAGRCRTQETGGPGSGSAGSAGAPGRADFPGRFHVGTALDVQELEAFGA